MSEIKLVYFDIKARGEPIRLVLEAAGKKYEDVRVTFDKWPAEKPNTPYGQLPYVVYKGKTYGQSIALAAFFAREYGLYGKSNLDALRVDEVIGICGDLMDATIKCKFEKDEAKKAELLKKLKEDNTPTTLGFFQKLLKDNGNSGYFVGSTVSLADLMVYNLIDFLKGEYAEADKVLPEEVKKTREAVEAHTLLKAYLKRRPVTPF